MSHKLLIYGTGGSGREIAAWAAAAVWDSEPFELLGFIDDAGTAAVNGIRVFTLEDAARLTADARVIVAVGDPGLRERLAERAAAVGLRAAPPLVHPSVQIADGLVQLGDGTVICPGSIVTVNVRIGAHVQINVHSTVMHDARIGDYATLSPATRINGNVHVAARAFLGSAATTVNGSGSEPLRIGERAVVGAGAVVTKDVPAGVTVTGVPARVHNGGTPNGGEGASGGDENG